MLGRPAGKMTVIRGAQDAVPARAGDTPHRLATPPPQGAGHHRPTLPGMQPETRHAPID